MKKHFLIAMVAVLICLAFAMLAGLSFAKHKKDNHVGSIEQTIKLMLEDYKGRNQQLFKKFEEQLVTTGNSEFDKARENVKPLVNKVTEFKYCSKLCYAMAKDKLKGGNLALDMLAPDIASMVVIPCEEGQADVINALNDYLLRLQENDTQFKAGLADLLNKENFSVLDLGLNEDFLESNMQLIKKIKGIATDKILAATETVIEILFIKSTYNSIKAAMAPIVVRLTASFATGGTLAVVDGPFPIGDVAGGVVAIGGTALTAYDIYSVTRKLPSELESYMTSMIDKYQKDIKEKALKQAKDVLQLCDDSCVEISSAIEK